MYESDKIFQRIGDIINPYLPAFSKRYSNHTSKRFGSRFVNYTSCPLCEIYLRPNSCGDCPMELEFGNRMQDNLEGCKVAIIRAWGPFTFGDYPKMIVRTQPFNPQLQNINRFVVSLIPTQSIARMR